MDYERITAAVNWLVDDWCEVRKFAALRHVLAAYPMEGTTPNDWAHLREALRTVLSACAAELSEAEKATLQGLVSDLEAATA
jgi:hypothetical protein